METQEIVSYTVTAVSHIGPVRYSITTDITGDDEIKKFLAKGVLYEGQRIGASKAVKALGGGRRSDIPFSQEACDEVQVALQEVFGDSAEISTREYVKQPKADTKFVRAHAIIDAIEMSGGSLQKLANNVGYTGDCNERSEAFLRKITDYKP